MRARPLPDARPPALLAALLLAPALAWGQTPAAAPGDPACDDGVGMAILEAGRTGVQREVSMIRDPDQGIASPLEILDISCLDRLFNYRAYDVLFDTADALDDLLGLLERRICAEAADFYAESIGTTPAIPHSWVADLRDVPGVRARPIFGNALEDAGAEGGVEGLIR